MNDTPRYIGDFIAISPAAKWVNSNLYPEPLPPVELWKAHAKAYDFIGEIKSPPSSIR
jgi:hypothetical protein